MHATQGAGTSVVRILAKNRLCSTTRVPVATLAFARSIGHDYMQGSLGLRKWATWTFNSMIGWKYGESQKGWLASLRKESIERWALL